jgi:hypothetical protein
MNYVEVFKVFFRLKRREIVEIAQEYWEDKVKDNIIPILIIVGVLLVVCPALYWLSYGLAYYSVEFGLVSATAVHGDYVGAGSIIALTGLITVWLVANILRGGYTFIRWIRRNWRESKRIVKDKELKFAYKLVNGPH